MKTRMRVFYFEQESVFMMNGQTPVIFQKQINRV
jgi:hypothetical protein